MAKSLCIVASPIMCNRTKEIWTEQLNFAGSPSEDGYWDNAKLIDVKKDHKTNAPKPLYARIDDDKLNEYKEHFSKPFDMSELKNW